MLNSEQEKQSIEQRQSDNFKAYNAYIRKDILKLIDS